MNRRIRILALTLGAGLTLTSCAAIPMEGAVERANPVEEVTNQGVRYFPSGPVSGASREEIVQGFLEAGTGVQGNFAVAREYLSSDLAQRWRPEQRIIIVDGQASMKTTATDAVEVSLQSFGEVDAQGNYRVNVQPRTETVDLKLVIQDGEWRISSAPDVIVLQRQEFADLFRSRNIYFFDSQHRYVTTDMRWVVANRDEATRAVELLLAGPTDWLTQGNAVVSAVPEGVRLLQPVAIENGRAVVNLSGELSDAKPEQLRMVRLQLEQTLKEVLAISAVEIRVNGAAIDVKLPGKDEVIVQTEVNPAPLVAKDDQIGYLSGGEINPPGGAASVVQVAQQHEVIRGALSMSRKTATLLTRDETLAMRFSDEEPQLIDTRPGQIEPSLDNWDYVWTQSTEQTGLYYTRIGDPGATEISLPEGVEDDFVTFQISRDGVRMAFLYRTGDRIELAIAPIERGENGEPIRLGKPVVLRMPGADATDVAWVDSNTVAMLVDVPDGSTDVRIYRVGGELTSLGTIQDAVQIAGSNTLSGMRVIDRNGTLYASRGSGWRSNAATVSFLFAQE